MRSLRVMAWNICRGGLARTLAIAAAVAVVAPDVVFLAEYDERSGGELGDLLGHEGYRHQLGGEDPAGGHSGLLVASRLELEPGPVTYASEVDGHRFRHVRVEGWDLFGAHIPGAVAEHRRKEAFWRFLLGEVAARHAERDALIIGDLNTGLHYRDELGRTFMGAEHLEALLERGWRDAWVEQNPRRRPPWTWLSPEWDNPFRLDHALLSPNAPRPRVVDYPETIGGVPVVGQPGLSDHLPVRIDLRRARPG